MGMRIYSVCAMYKIYIIIRWTTFTRVTTDPAYLDSKFRAWDLPRGNGDRTYVGPAGEYAKEEGDQAPVGGEEEGEGEVV